MCHEKDWSDLSMELINLISKKLSKLSDFVKFRAVCKTWCSSAPLFDHPPQLPWLIERGLGSHLVNGLRFYSPFSGETGTIIRKKFDQGTNYMGSGPSHGCLLLSDRSKNNHSYKLFNPLTNEEICLPPLHYSNPCLVWTGTDPTRNRDIIAIEQYLLLNNNSWAFYRRDNNDWIVSTGGLIFSSCFFRGMLFSSTTFRFTNVFDVSTKERLYTIPPPDEVIHDLTSYLLESAGEILTVSFNFQRSIKFETIAFHIYKLEFDERNSPLSWVKINNVGDQMLFLDAKHGFSISSRSFPGYRGNCIYFLYENHMPCRYNIEDGKTERLWFPFGIYTSWFVPDLR